jgi:alpha-glucuronidase
MTSTMYAAWLQYYPIQQAALKAEYIELLNTVVVEEQSQVIKTAIEELNIGISSMLGITPMTSKQTHSSSYLWVGSVKAAVQGKLKFNNGAAAALGPEGFLIQYNHTNEEKRLILIGGSDIGVLYGVFYLLRHMSTGHSLLSLNHTEQPKSQLRMINQWDNVDGSIERGYAGGSIFYQNDRITSDITRIKDYARMLSSVGINGISINNVNVHAIETKFITPEKLPEIAKIADVFRCYGIRLYLSVNFASPMQIGGLSTADPLEAVVKAWWKATAENIYKYIPDFGGFVVKADSEHRPGPFTYGRDHADGANMLAEALEPYGGLVIWRCFVYNCMQNWRDRSTDRARAAYDHFKPLDGRFHDNVILQIKNGPMDFQVREPVSPLFGSMTETNQLMEFQITQEYTGQQKHLCYLVPQWKEVLDFETHAKGDGSAVKSIVSGNLFGMKYSGYAAVSNIGNDDNWTGHTLAQANLYGYGRLIWNTELSSETIAKEWIRLTFGDDEQVMVVLLDMLLQSWGIYENYTSPLGVGWMITPNHHYGPDVDGYEYSRWGTYHFADRDGIGVDRTIESGTGYSSQYFSPNINVFNSLKDCPDELLLFFHHVPYTHLLKSGKTIIQHIYDTHFDGAQQAETLMKLWGSLEGKVDKERFEQVLSRQQEQAEHSKHWRDVINTYFYRKSGIPDRQGRTIY